MTHFHAVKVSETMGIREAAMYPSCRAGETIWCTGDILAILPILVWQFRASKCGYLLCEHVSSQKRYAVLAERKKAKSTRCRTSDALNPLSVIMVDCWCACLLRIGCDTFHFVPRMWLIRQRADEFFDSHVMCWIPKRPRIAPPLTQMTLCIYMQRLVALRLAKNRWRVLRRWRGLPGVEQVMCWFFELRGRELDNKITSWVSHQLCFRRRSFSLCRRFCVVSSAMLKKESVFFCLFKKTMSFRKDTRRMYTS